MSEKKDVFPTYLPSNACRCEICMDIWMRYYKKDYNNIEKMEIENKR